ncbi:vWA domain-containing protein [Parvibaculum sp.]|uniref:vWA domain-containing protein n=1 Tax=Parvibaculum sp. TaxID=2024848 RepID=UPI003BAC55BC
MNPHLTEIAYILDRSGSMQPMQEPAVAAFNDFIKAQLDVPGDARLTLVQFDDAYEVPVAAMPIQNVPQLTAATYTPRGSTALLDAIGRTILETDRRISALPQEARPGKVILAIFTDGAENASRQYSARHISDLIRLYRDEKGWEFLFLAANQDAIATAASMQMDGHFSGNVSFNEKGVKSSGTAMARKVRAMRMKSSGTMDAQALEDDAKPLNDIVQEEEQK